MSDITAKRQLDELYAGLPTIACQGLCHSSCGPIQMTRVEHERIRKKTGRYVSHHPQTLTCNMLAAKRCRVYTIRPLICRLWGLCEGMECPWGCKPEPRYLTKLEAYELHFRAQAISDPDTSDEMAAAIERLHDSPGLVALAGTLWQKPRIE